MWDFLNTRGGRLTTAVVGIAGVYAIDAVENVVKTGMKHKYEMKAESDKYGSVSFAPHEAESSQGSAGELVAGKSEQSEQSKQSKQHENEEEKR